MKLKRGDVVVAVFPGELGKPRPAIVIQADAFFDTYSTVLCCPFTTHLIEAPFLRPTIDPGIQNGLQSRSQVMVEKITPVRKEVIAQQIGSLADEDLSRIEMALIQITGLGHSIAPFSKTADREQP